ncbi:MAG: hypothetical protein ACKPKO_11505, partial [Candidatus Fonsibacter sp.]
MMDTRCLLQAQFGCSDRRATLGRVGDVTGGKGGCYDRPTSWMLTAGKVFDDFQGKVISTHATPKTVMWKQYCHACIVRH